MQPAPAGNTAPGHRITTTGKSGRPCPGAPAGTVDDEAAHWEAAAQIRRERPGWVVIWVARKAGARGKGDIARFFDGTDLIPPGIADVADWRPGRTRARSPAGRPVLFWAGVGRKPAAPEQR